MPFSTVLRLVLDAIDSPKLLLNPNLTVEFANKAFIRQYGRPDYLGKKCHSLLFHRSKPCSEYGYKCPLIDSQSSQRPIKVLHSEIGPTGSLHWDIETSPILGPDGRPEYYLESIVRRNGNVTPLTLKGIVAHSRSVKMLLQRISKVTTTDLPLLFIGPHGSGKREFARLVHENSRRACCDFVTLNCQGLTPEKLSQQLHLRSSDLLSRGGGTLYLSEISQLSREMQATLLTLMETGAWTLKKGDSEEKIFADLRIICSSSMTLHELELFSNLRLDFLLSISVCPLVVPGLEKRTEDIPELVHLLLDDLHQNGMKLEVTESVITALQNRKHWKGHVTEMQTILMRAAALSEKATIDLADIMEIPFHESEEATIVSNSEEERINNLILSWKGSKRALAQRLGISERTLYRRLQKLTPMVMSKEGTA